MGEMGADCFHTLVMDSRHLEKPEWDEERFGMVCSTAKNFADTKAVIEKLCHQSGNCTYEEREKIRAFFRKVELFDSARRARQLGTEKELSAASLSDGEKLP